MGASSPRRSMPENEMSEWDQLDVTGWEWVDSDETGTTASRPQAHISKPTWWQATAFPPETPGPSRAIEQILPYHITSWHSSPENMAPGRSSWRASLTFAVRSPGHLLPGATLPWRENIAAHCYEDRISLDFNPGEGEMIHTQGTAGARRMIKIAWVSGAGTRASSADNSLSSMSGSDSDWEVTIDVSCANRTWLDGLSRDEVAELVRFDTAYSITGRLWRLDSDILEVPKIFQATRAAPDTQSDSHPKCPKAAADTTSMSLMDLRCKGLWKPTYDHRLDIEDLQLRRVVYENIVRHINGI